MKNKPEIILTYYGETVKSVFVSLFLCTFDLHNYNHRKLMPGPEQINQTQSFPSSKLSSEY